MTENAEIKQRVEDATSNHDIEVKSARIFGDTLFIEATSRVNDLSYLAAVWFFKLSDQNIKRIAIRHNSSGENQEYDIYGVIGRLISAEDGDNAAS